MAIIEEGHPALAGTPSQYLADTLKNSRILLYDLDKAIYALTKEEVKTYSVNTGQTVINASRQDLPLLIKARADLMAQIRQLEEQLDDTSRAVQVVPY
jgi:hypothetical protein